MERRSYAQSVPLRMSFIAALVALSIVGSFLKIPSPTGTVALDSLPGFLGSLSLGYPEGASVSFLGHLLTSLNVGFPLGFPLHFLIALEMAGIAVLFRWVFLRWKAAPAIVAGTLSNGILAPLGLVPLLGWGFFFGVFPSLLVGSFVNIVLAMVVHRFLPK
ncbi:MAG: ECF transporter S component [Candidatus Caldatribacteriaceae bacterium]